MRLISTLTCLLILTGTLFADVWVVRSKPQRNVWAVTNSSESPNSSTATPAPAVKPSLTTGSDDALDEVNAYRAKRGLPAFKHDAQLTIAAKRAAETRAKALWDGHLANDFACLPSGATADAAGCGALEDSFGWGTCCADGSYEYAGAAWVRGTNGLRFMHLFVRGQQAQQAQQVNSPECTSGTCNTTRSASRRRR